MYVENRTKIANFPTHVYLTPPLKGFPLEFCIGAGVSENYNDGAFRWSKKFFDRFSRFDTKPECDSKPPSHVAVAITLNAKASSLKMVCGVGGVSTGCALHTGLAPRVRLNCRLLPVFCCHTFSFRTRAPNQSRTVFVSTHFSLPWIELAPRSRNVSLT